LGLRSKLVHGGQIREKDRRKDIGRSSTVPAEEFGYRFGRCSPELRWALVEAAHQACQRRSPDHALYLAGKQRSSGKHAALTVARRIARRAHHVLAELEQAA
jgi:hypothetical protein